MASSLYRIGYVLLAVVLVDAVIEGAILSRPPILLFGVWGWVAFAGAAVAIVAALAEMARSLWS
jgi:hypothetical protein